MKAFENHNAATSTVEIRPPRLTERSRPADVSPSLWQTDADVVVHPRQEDRVTIVRQYADGTIDVIRIEPSRPYDS
jgi:hypothetical protein